MKKLHTLLFVGILTLNFAMPALQAQIISGRVYDNSNPTEALIGVNIFWMGTTQGTISDAEGRFHLQQIPGKHKLVFSYVGYRTDTLKIGQDGPLNIFMTQGTDLSEVTINERVASSSISKINPILTQNITSKELTKFACCNLSESFETNASVDVAYADAVSGIKQIKMLGLSGRYSQLMMENIPIIRGSESAFGLDYIPGTWMESIQVSKGTSAVKNGYESITGQINIQYKNPDYKEKMHLYFYGNQDGKVESNAGVSFKPSENWGTTVLIHGGSNTRKLDMNEDGFLDKPLSYTGNLMNRWSYMGRKMEAKFGVSFLTESRQGGQVDFNHDVLPQDQASYGINIDVSRLNAFSKIGFLLERPNTSIGWITSANYFKRNSFYGIQSLDVNQFNLYMNLMYQSYLINTEHTFTTGISAVYDNNEELFNKSDVGFTEFVPGVFLEYNYLPSKQFSLMLGLRNDFSSIHGNFITPRVHAKYNFPAYTTLRVSAGKGYRTPSIISENTPLMASSRTLIIETSTLQEEAWNYGISASNEIPLGSRNATLTLEFFRTDFQNQLMVDLYQQTNEVHFYNLSGSSYANSFQVEAFYELFTRFELTAGFRVNEVKATYGSTLQKVPYMSNYKGLVSGQYRTHLDKWQFDMTLQFHGMQQLPPVSGDLASSYSNESEAFMNIIAQVTKNYRSWSFYVGAENLNNFTQKNAIIAPENPFGSDFDASRIWGPLYGRMFYAGIKYNLDY